MLRHSVPTAILAAMLAWAAPAFADYEAGQKAWDAGRPAEARAEWRAAADAEDQRAMLALGRLYLQGLGAPQDYVEAHKWFNLAASRGAMEAAAERDALAAKMTPAKMTPAQIAAAQERATAWRSGGAAPATAEAEAPAVQPAASSDDAGPPPPRAIREAQKLLTALGYAPGLADGIWGGRTAEAYRLFLRDSGMPAAAALTPGALRAMRAAAKGGIAAAASAAAPAPAERAAPSAAAVRSDAAAHAAQAGDIDGLKAALAVGAKANARDARGRTALMYAADKGYVLMVAPLLAAGADPDVRAPDGATALFMAAAHGHSEIVALLMEAGVEVSIKGPKGKTAVDVARAVYGDADAAREKGENLAVLALLEGMTLAAVAAAKDNEAFARATSLETVSAYDRYLWLHPDGRHADKARRLRAAVAEREWLARELAREEAARKEAAREALEKADRERAVGHVFRDCPACPEMVVVPAGSFMMGSPGSEKDRDDDEGPVHRVTISAPFAVGMYEVTFEEWDACVRGGGGGGYRPDDEDWGRGRRPAINVSWEDAQAYVDWLSRKTGGSYRLLSESEWEYAARAGTTTRHHWGDDIGRNRANCEDCGSRWDDEKTAPVGSFGANGFGLHDVHGNVWEWVEDCRNDSYAGAPSDGSAWESGNCDQRVLRGSSWGYDPRYLRAANRGWNGTGYRHDSSGFRVARTLTR